MARWNLALVTFGCDIVAERAGAHANRWCGLLRRATACICSSTLPIASPHCEWRTMVLRALESQKRKYRIAYSSSNSNVVNAAVQAGLAVGAVPEICVRPGMRVLTEKDGFPDLGSFGIGMVRKPGRRKLGCRGAGAACDGKLSARCRGMPMMAAE